MKIKWYGHSCFELSDGKTTVIFDPYQPGSVPGVELPEGLCADAVLCSHSHGDHGWAEGVKLTGRETDAEIKRIPVYHDKDKGKKRGNNLISVVELGGKRIAHFGDLGHLLSDEQVDEIGKLDVIMIPVGGFFTINAQEALETVRRFEPCIVIPMHYRGKGFGYIAISSVKAYTSLVDDVICVDSNEITLEDFKAPATVVLRCPQK